MQSTRHTRLFAESVKVLGSQLVAMIGSLALIRALSEQLSPAAYGALTLGMTGVMLVNQAISGGTIAAIGRYFTPAREEQGLFLYLSGSIKILWTDQRLIVALTVAVAVVLGVIGRDEWILLTLAAGFAAISGCWFIGLIAILTAARQRFSAGGLAAIDPWLKLLFLRIGWRWFAASPAVTLLIYGLCTAVLTLVAYGLVRKLLGASLVSEANSRVAGSNPWLEPMRVYAKPFRHFGILTWLQQASDRWALQAWMGTAVVGQYAVVYQLGYSPVGILSNVLNTLVAPVLYGRAGDGTSQVRNLSVHRLVGRLTALGLLLSGLILVVALLAHRWIFALLVGPAYQGFSIWFPWMVLAGSLFAVGQLIALKFMSDNRTADLGRVKSMTAILGVLFNVIGAASFGMAGIVVAQNLFSVFYLGWMIHMGLRSPLVGKTDA